LFFLTCNTLGRLPVPVAEKQQAIRSTRSEKLLIVPEPQTVIIGGNAQLA
jgi:hypothetical protein